MSSTRGDTTGSTARTLSRLRMIDTTPAPAAAPEQPPFRHEQIAGSSITMYDDYEPGSTQSKTSIAIKENDTPHVYRPHVTSYSDMSTSTSASSSSASARPLRAAMSASALDDSFVIVGNRYKADSSTQETPVKHRSIEELVGLNSGQEVNTRTFHPTQLVHIDKPDGRVYYYFKQNPVNSLMSELEAMAVAYFRLIAPKYFPSACAHFDERQRYVGVSSKALEDFESLKDDPVTDLDLQDNTIVTALAITLTTSYIFEEDDLHRGNISKTGKRIDGDGLIWPILSEFKDGSLGDKVFRRPNANSFVITEHDIHHFPNLTDAKPFYWPTSPAPIIPESYRNLLKQYGVPISLNAYSYHENDLIKKLSTNPVFIYHKFKTLLKFILTDANMYRKIAKMHVRENIVDSNNISLIERNVAHQEERIKQMRKVLVNMPEFKSFIRTNGKPALDEIIAEFNMRNIKIEDKLKKLSEERTQQGADTSPSKLEETYSGLSVNTEEIRRRYSEICLDVFENKLEASRTWLKI